MKNLQSLKRPGERHRIEYQGYHVEVEVKDTGEWFLHLPSLQRWSATVYKQLLETLTDIREAAAQRGVHKLYVFIPADDPKLYKFELMMGFLPEEGYRNEVGKEFLLMSLEASSGT